MTPRTLPLLAAVASTLLATTAWAGYRYAVPVQINVLGRTAKGSLGDARASADTRQVIGCRVLSGAGGGSTVSCYATDAAGTSVQCSSADASLIATGRALTGDSLLTFTWDPAGTCTSLQIEVYSSNTPLQP